MFAKRVFTCFLLLCSMAIAGAATGQSRSVKILGLSVEGNTSASADMILLSSGLSVGKEVTGDDIQTAIRSLWGMDAFSDVQILVDREVRDGVFLNIRVKEHPRLQNVEIDGNKKLKTEEIEDELNLYRSQRISPGILARARKKLKDKYKEKGYLLAEVNPTMREIEGTDLVDVVITISEGKKVQIQEIDFHGNEAFDDGKLRKQMKKTKEDKWWRGADYDREEYEEDKENVLSYYRNNGFRDVEILSDSVYYGPEQDDIYIDIWLEEGIQYYFGEISWSGNSIYSVEELENILDFKEGDVYSKEKIDNAVFDKIGGKYYDNGYIYANTVPDIYDSVGISLYRLECEVGGLYYKVPIRSYCVHIVCPCCYADCITWVSVINGLLN